MLKYRAFLEAVLQTVRMSQERQTEIMELLRAREGRLDRGSCSNPSIKVMHEI